jgi:hypothetical protein
VRVPRILLQFEAKPPGVIGPGYRHLTPATRHDVDRMLASDSDNLTTPDIATSERAIRERVEPMPTRSSEKPTPAAQLGTSLVVSKARVS